LKMWEEPAVVERRPRVGIGFPYRVARGNLAPSSQRMVMPE
jgi:hypothetical protein